MANMTFGVNIIPKANTNVTLGNSDNPWTITEPTITGSISMGRKSNTTVGDNSAAIGEDVEASGANCYATGTGTVANHLCQYVAGEYNVADASSASASERGTYIEIIGNGTASDALSNARSLDWSGNEYLKGDLYVGCGADSSGGTKVVKEGCTWGNIKGN